MPIGPIPENRARLMLAIIKYRNRAPDPSNQRDEAHEELMQAIDDIFKPIASTPVVPLKKTIIHFNVYNAHSGKDNKTFTVYQCYTIQPDGVWQWDEHRRTSMSEVVRDYPEDKFELLYCGGEDEGVELGLDLTADEPADYRRQDTLGEDRI